MDRRTASDLADVVRALGAPEARIKVATAEVKTSPTDGSGTFTALVSTFGGEPDSQGDVVAPGAFADTIRNAYAKRTGRGGQYLWPTYWAHGYADPSNAIGGIVAASETPHGLVVEGTLDLSNPKAVDVYEGMLADRIREWSISYAVIREHIRADGATVLDEVELLEISAVMAGANRNTRTLAVKQAETELQRYKRLILEATPPSPLERRQKQLEEMREELIREVRAERVDRERIAELARINSDRAARMANGPTLAVELAADELRYRREVANLIERDAERERDAEVRERVGEARRREGRDRISNGSIL